MRRLITDWTGLTVAGVIIIVLAASGTLLGESGSGFKNYPVPTAPSTGSVATTSNSGSFATVPSGTLLPQKTSTLKRPSNLLPANPTEPASVAHSAPMASTSSTANTEASPQPYTAPTASVNSVPAQNSTPAFPSETSFPVTSGMNPPVESAFSSSANSSQSASTPPVVSAQNSSSLLITETPLAENADSQTTSPSIPENPFSNPVSATIAQAPASSTQTVPDSGNSIPANPASMESTAAQAPQSQAASAGQNQTAPYTAPQSGVVPAQSEQTAASTVPPTSGVLTDNASATAANGILPPPEGFSMTAEEEALLDQFLKRWEEFGRHIKRVACEVQIKEHDGGLFMQNTKGGKIPLSHTWGKFKFITPNRLSYHVEGEYAYQPGASSDDEPKMEFKKGSGELKYVCDGKSWAEYDYKNRIVNVYAIPEDQWNRDLSMDGPIPLFFIANAQNLKNRFYLNIVTPKNRTESEVWIEAYPRQIADSGSFQRIIIILSLADLQPTYMRKYYVNGKSYSELWFQNVTINKGMWKIEADVDFGWEKKIMDETFAITPIEPAVPANSQNTGVKPTSGTLPAEE